MDVDRGAVRLHDVSRRFRIDGDQVVTALDGVTLDVAPGSVVALSGPSGSGRAARPRCPPGCPAASSSAWRSPAR